MRKGRRIDCSYRLMCIERMEVAQDKGSSDAIMSPACVHRRLQNVQ